MQCEVSLFVSWVQLISQECFILQPLGRLVVPVQYRPTYYTWSVTDFGGFSAPRPAPSLPLLQGRASKRLTTEGNNWNNAAWRRDSLSSRRPAVCSQVDKTPAIRLQRRLCQVHSRALKVKSHRVAKTTRKSYGYKWERKMYGVGGGSAGFNCFIQDP